MTDIFLAKQKSPPGWLDLTVGEPYLIKDILFETFGFDTSYTIDLDTDNKSEYPPPHGYEPLVKLLEDKYQAPVVITNGAKQALGATFHALKKMGKSKLGMRTPYWALIPPLAKVHGLDHSEKYDCYLAILPNNPDGFMFDFSYMKWLADWHKDLSIPFIHDAAYYTPIYIPTQYNFGPVGDVQIFSISKMYGISGLRVGYVVCHNRDYYRHIQEYVETMTAGVSTASQDICNNILSELYNNSSLNQTFIKKCKDALFVNKAIAKTIDSSILEVPADITNIPGMFLWAKAKNNCFKETKINVSDGKYFGGEGFIRMNLACPLQDMVEAANRLNSFGHPT